MVRPPMDGTVTLMWLKWGNTDYLGARMLLLSGLLIQGSAHRTVPTVLAEAALTKDQRILHKNVATDTSQAEELFSKPSHSYDVRRLNGITIEVFYQSLHITDDLSFEVEGFAPRSDRQFALSNSTPPPRWAD